MLRLIFAMMVATAERTPKRARLPRAPRLATRGALSWSARFRRLLSGEARRVE